MGWMAKDLGNGVWNITDDGVPSANPYVSFNGTITSNPQLTQNFGRILNEQFNDNEQVLVDVPQSFDNTFEYVGVANNTASPSDPVWMVIRVTWILNRKTKMQFRSSVIWNNRTLGWS